MLKIVKRFFTILKLIYFEIWAKLSPVGYARAQGVKIGDNVTFYGMRPGNLGSEPWMISIGNNVYITAGFQFITHDGGTLILRKEVPDLEWSAPISIGNDVYIGLRTMIMPGVIIGNRVIIGAGSIVTKSIPDNSVAVGAPARVIKSVDDYLEIMKKKSLKIGHLSAREKDLALRSIFAKTRDGNEIEEVR